MKTPATHCCAMSSEIVSRHRITQDRKAYGPDIPIAEKEILFLLNVMAEERKYYAKHKQKKKKLNVKLTRVETLFQTVWTTTFVLIPSYLPVPVIISFS